MTRTRCSDLPSEPLELTRLTDIGVKHFDRVLLADLGVKRRKNRAGPTLSDLVENRKPTGQKFTLFDQRRTRKLRAP